MKQWRIPLALWGGLSAWVLWRGSFPAPYALVASGMILAGLVAAWRWGARLALPATPVTVAWGVLLAAYGAALTGAVDLNQALIGTLVLSAGVAVYWGVDQNGTVFATQTPPNMNDPDGWSPLPKPRWEATKTVVAPTTETVDLTLANTSIVSPVGVGTGSGWWTPYSADGGIGVYMEYGVDYTYSSYAGMVYQAPTGSTISQLTFTGVVFNGWTTITNPAVYYRTSLTGTWTQVWANAVPDPAVNNVPNDPIDGATQVTLPSGAVQVLIGNQLIPGSDLLNGNVQLMEWNTVFQSPVVTLALPAATP